MSPLALNLGETPDLIGRPAITDALGVAQNDFSVLAFLAPAFGQERVLSDLGQFDVSISRQGSVLGHFRRGILWSGITHLFHPLTFPQY